MVEWKGRGMTGWQKGTDDKDVDEGSGEREKRRRGMVGKD